MTPLLAADVRRLEIGLAEALSLNMGALAAVDSLLDGGGFRASRALVVLKSIRGELRNGATLGQALARNPGSVSVQFAAIVRIGERTDDIAVPARAFLESLDRDELSRRLSLGAVFYWCAILMVFLWMCKAVSHVPEDLRIEHSFIKNALAQSLNAPSAVAFSSLAALAAMAGILTVGRRYVGRVADLVPGLRSVRNLRVAATISERVALLVFAGELLPRALEVAGHHGNHFERNEIGRLAKRLRDGGSVDAARHSRLPVIKLVTPPLALGIASGDIVGSLRRAREAFNFRRDRLEQGLRAGVWGIGMVVIAALVGWGLSEVYALLTVAPSYVWG